MCGFAGQFDFGRCRSAEVLTRIVTGMRDTLRHRGPDDDGVWVDAGVGIALGHRRLSILDLSSCGHQPMLSADGRFVIVFNGEIYNFKDLRDILVPLGHRFRGHSDTEVVLAAFTEWGVESALKRFVGMFAFALWDREERTLYLGRDRMGEKPLFYGWANEVLLFGSELKALRKHPAWVGEIDCDALALFLRHNYISAPRSIYRGVFKLPAGTWLALPMASSHPGALPGPEPFWSLRRVAEDGMAAPFLGSETEAADELEGLLRQSVGSQMVADVPLGAFLSGGIDSSTIVALMQTQSSRRVKTFTIGFRETRFNEAKFATDVARHLGTEHTELYVSPDETLAVIPRLPTIFDEPFSDSSQIPTFLVCQLARRHVTVSLSGDGGDELFGGYPRYALAESIWSRLSPAPSVGRKALARLLRSVPVEGWNICLGWLARLAQRRPRDVRVGDRLHKLAEILDFASAEQIYHGLISHWKDPQSVVVGAREPATVLNDPSTWPRLPDFHHRMMYLDAVTYLPDDILVKVDRAGMAVSLESRIPLLDHRLIEFAWRLPLGMKVRGGQSKWLLRQVLYRHVPPSLIERPKMGFAVPIDAWLRGPLRDWAESVLSESQLRSEGLFEARLVRKKWEEHISGKRNWQYHLWDVLMFQAWWQAQHSNATQP